MNIGEKIKKIRTEKFMTQSEVAGELITRNMLSCIENGSAQPSLQTLIHIADKLHVSPGYLIADENDESFYKKMEEASNIKKAYLSENMKICRDMCCKTTLDDDEIKLIHTEAAFALGVESFDAGRLKECCRYFDEAILCAQSTFYDTTHTVATICAYLKYIKKISFTLSSEIIDEDEYESCLAIDNEFVRYSLIMDSIEANDRASLGVFGGKLPKDSVYALHVSARVDMQNSDYAEAYKKLYGILTRPVRIQEPIMYFVFYDLEVCSKEIGDFKAAYEYSNNKLELLQKLLSD